MLEISYYLVGAPVFWLSLQWIFVEIEKHRFPWRPLFFFTAVGLGLLLLLVGYLEFPATNNRSGDPGGFIFVALGVVELIFLILLWIIGVVTYAFTRLRRA